MRKLTCTTLVIFMITGGIMVSFTFLSENVTAADLYVGGPGPGNYTTIQEAIDNSTGGDTIYVYNGTYQENVEIDKGITLIGESAVNTIIDGAGLDSTVKVLVNDVSISKFTVTGSIGGAYNGGIDLHGSGLVNYCNVSHCNVTGNSGTGFVMVNAWYNEFYNNTIFSNGASMFMIYADHNTFTENVFYSNGGDGIFMFAGDDYNTFIHTKFLDCGADGVFIHEGSKGNEFYDVEFNDCNDYGVEVEGSNSNSDLLFVNCSFLNIANNDFHLDFGANVTTLNTTFDKSGTHYIDTLSELTVQWLMHVFVRDLLGNPIANADVWVNDSYGSNIYSRATDANGYCRWIVSVEYIENILGHKAEPTPHTVTAFKNGYRKGYAAPDPVMNTSKTVIVTLYPHDPSAPVYNINTGENFTAIQDAIDDADTLDGHMIYADDGHYTENVIVNKRLRLIGQSRENAIIDGGGTDDAVRIITDWVSIETFNVTNSGSNSGDAGINVYYANNCSIDRCNVLNNQLGIRLWYSNDAEIMASKVSDNDGDGILVVLSNDEILTDNTISSNGGFGIRMLSSSDDILENNAMMKEGIFIGGSLENWNTHSIDISNTVNGKPVHYLKDRAGDSIPPGAGQVILANCTDILIENQTLANGSAAFLLGYSSDNVIVNNMVSNNYYGTYLYSSSGNEIYHNNFVDNTNQAYDDGANIWDDGYPSGGNYWSDYTGVDFNSTPAQDEPPSDGIGDTPYVIDANSRDNFPLMSRFEYTEFNIPLSLGWNLISVPVRQLNQSLDTVLENITGKWDYVQTYDDSSDPWKTYGTFKPPALNDLNSIGHTNAYWIHITEPVTFTVKGDAFGSEMAIPLRAGWNLVGYPSLVERSILLALDGTGYDRVEGFDGAAPYLIKELDDTYVMKPGEGYWVHVPSDTVWTVGGPTVPPAPYAIYGRVYLYDGTFSGGYEPRPSAGGASVNVTWYDIFNNTWRTVNTATGPTGQYSVNVYSYVDGGVVYVNATFDSSYGNNGYNYTHIDVVGSPSGIYQDVVCGVPYKVVITGPSDGSVWMSGASFDATYEIQDRDGMIAQGYYTFADGPMEWFSSDPSFVAPAPRTFNGTADANPGTQTDSLTLYTSPSQWINISEGGSGESNPYLTEWGQFYIDPDETLAGWQEDWDIITLNLI